MKIYRLKKDWSYVISNGNIGFHMNYKKGDIFYKPSEVNELGLKTFGPDYYPENGSYAVSEHGDFHFVEYFELIGETDKPKDYFIDKKYTQAEMDEILN